MRRKAVLRLALLGGFVVRTLTHRSGRSRQDPLWYATGLSRSALPGRLRDLETSKPFRSAWQHRNLVFMTDGYLEVPLETNVKGIVFTRAEDE